MSQRAHIELFVLAKPEHGGETVMLFTTCNDNHCCGFQPQLFNHGLASFGGTFIGGVRLGILNIDMDGFCSF